MKKTNKIQNLLTAWLLLAICLLFSMAVPDNSANAEAPSAAEGTVTSAEQSPANNIDPALTEAGSKDAGLLEKTSEETKNKQHSSLFDKYHAVEQYQNISTDLEPFGYRFFFKSGAKAQETRNDIPVSSDYVIGPGDEVRIMFWGRINEEHNLTVDKDGNISIPKIGPLQIAGMTFGEMKQYITSRTQEIIGSDINITMGRLKSIQIFVLGEVKNPGSYSVDSFSTITSALIAAGGPTEIGSLRSIQLKRDNKTAAVLDFYSFLLKGDKSNDRMLKAGDVIFIPTVGPLVGIAGNVKRPAIYELSGEHSLKGLFEMAGGVTPGAFTQQIQVERIKKNDRQIVIDINDKDLSRTNEFVLQDGDLIKVFSIVDRNVNVVFLEGNVKRPGKYEYKNGMRIKDLIGSSGDLLKETYFEYAYIKRLQLPGLQTKIIPFNPGKLLFENDSANNIELEPQDIVFIFSKWLFRGKPTVTVQGEVRKGGTFRLIENYRVKDAILDSGGLTDDASLHRGEIFRTDERGDIIQIYFNVGLAMAGDSEENLKLHSRDKLVIHSIWENKYRHTVSIDGEIRNPGKFPLARGMRVSDLVFAAGNVLESAYNDEAEISCYLSDGIEKLFKKTINLGLALRHHPEHDIELGPYDRVLIRRTPGWQEEKYVSISGEVRFPGRYLVRKGEKLSSVIERAGGYSDNAYLRGAIFKRERVREMQQKSLDEMVMRLERDVLSRSSMQLSTAFSKDETESMNAELHQKQKFIESLKKLRASGRLSIRLADLALLKGSEHDIELEEADNLFIPMKNSVVDVVGAVMARGSFVYSDRFSHEEYIGLAGGYMRNADKSNAYVLKVDGSAKRLSGNLISSSVNSKYNLGENIKEIEPGDTIVVPEKVEHIAWMREVKDLTTILYQIAVATGITMVLF